jgi:hypothetical protein
MSHLDKFLQHFGTKNKIFSAASGKLENGLSSRAIFWFGNSTQELLVTVYQQPWHQTIFPDNYVAFVSAVAGLPQLGCHVCPTILLKQKP